MRSGVSAIWNVPSDSHSPHGFPQIVQGSDVVVINLFVKNIVHFGQKQFLKNATDKGSTRSQLLDGAGFAPRFLHWLPLPPPPLPPYIQKGLDEIFIVDLSLSRAISYDSHMARKAAMNKDDFIFQEVKCSINSCKIGKFAILTRPLGANLVVYGLRTNEVKKQFKCPIME
ncbi:hypothetical protein HUJ04_003392 [Dendroctonus ponderosae]|nr:hypothetical protein HUJ04_003392 [Dendroctonus ponderosae]